MPEYLRLDYQIFVQLRRHRRYHHNPLALLKWNHSRLIHLITREQTVIKWMFVRDSIANVSTQVFLCKQSKVCWIMTLLSLSSSSLSHSKWDVNTLQHTATHCNKLQHTATTATRTLQDSAARYHQAPCPIDWNYCWLIQLNTLQPK